MGYIYSSVSGRVERVDELSGETRRREEYFFNQRSTRDSWWNSITYGNGVFVAVAAQGSSVMTSPRNSPADNEWNSVTYGNGLFVAVSASGSGNRVMTSPDDFPE